MKNIEIGSKFKIGKVTVKVDKDHTYGYWLESSEANDQTYKQFGLNRDDIKAIAGKDFTEQYGTFPYIKTIESLQKVVDFLKSKEEIEECPLIKGVWYVSSKWSTFQAAKFDGLSPNGIFSYSEYIKFNTHYSGRGTTTTDYKEWDTFKVIPQIFLDEILPESHSDSRKVKQVYFEKCIKVYESLSLIGNIYEVKGNSLFFNKRHALYCSKEGEERRKYFIPSTKEEYDKQFIKFSEAEVVGKYLCALENNTNFAGIKKGEYVKVNYVSSNGRFNVTDEKRKILSLSIENDKSKWTLMSKDFKPIQASNNYPLYCIAMIDRPCGGDVLKGDIGVLIDDASGIYDFPRHEHYLTGKHYFPTKLDKYIGSKTKKDLDYVLNDQEYPPYIIALIDYPCGGSVLKGEIGNLINKHDGTYNFPSQSNYTVFKKQIDDKLLRRLEYLPYSYNTIDKNPCKEIDLPSVKSEAIFNLIYSRVPSRVKPKLLETPYVKKRVLI